MTESFVPYHGRTISKSVRHFIGLGDVNVNTIEICMMSEMKVGLSRIHFTESKVTMMLIPEPGIVVINDEEITYQTRTFSTTPINGFGNTFFPVITLHGCTRVSGAFAERNTPAYFRDINGNALTIFTARDADNLVDDNLYGIYDLPLVEPNDPRSDPISFFFMREGNPPAITLLESGISEDVLREKYRTIDSVMARHYLLEDRSTSFQHRPVRDPFADGLDTWALNVLFNLDFVALLDAVMFLLLQPVRGIQRGFEKGARNRRVLGKKKTEMCTIFDLRDDNGVKKNDYHLSLPGTGLENPSVTYQDLVAGTEVRANIYRGFFYGTGTGVNDDTVIYQGDTVTQLTVYQKEEDSYSNVTWPSTGVIRLNRDYDFEDFEYSSVSSSNPDDSNPGSPRNARDPYNTSNGWHKHVFTLASGHTVQRTKHDGGMGGWRSEVNLIDESATDPRDDGIKAFYEAKKITFVDTPNAGILNLTVEDDWIVMEAGDVVYWASDADTAVNGGNGSSNSAIVKSFNGRDLVLEDIRGTMPAEHNYICRLTNVTTVEKFFNKYFVKLTHSTCFGKEDEAHPSDTKDIQIDFVTHPGRLDALSNAAKVQEIVDNRQTLAADISELREDDSSAFPVDSKGNIIQLYTYLFEEQYLDLKREIPAGKRYVIQDRTEGSFSIVVHKDDKFFNAFYDKIMPKDSSGVRTASVNYGPYVFRELDDEANAESYDNGFRADFLGAFWKLKNYDQDKDLHSDRTKHRLPTMKDWDPENDVTERLAKGIITYTKPSNAVDVSAFQTEWTNVELIDAFDCVCFRDEEYRMKGIVEFHDAVSDAFLGMYTPTDLVFGGIMLNENGTGDIRKENAHIFMLEDWDRESLSNNSVYLAGALFQNDVPSSRQRFNGYYNLSELSHVSVENDPLKKNGEPMRYTMTLKKAIGGLAEQELCPSTVVQNEIKESVVTSTILRTANQNRLTSNVFVVDASKFAPSGTIILGKYKELAYKKRDGNDDKRIVRIEFMEGMTDLYDFDPDKKVWISDGSKIVELDVKFQNETNPAVDPQDDTWGQGLSGNSSVIRYITTDHTWAKGDTVEQYKKLKNHDWSLDDGTGRWIELENLTFTGDDKIDGNFADNIKNKYAGWQNRDSFGEYKIRHTWTGKDLLNNDVTYQEIKTIQEKFGPILTVPGVVRFGKAGLVRLKSCEVPDESGWNANANFVVYQTDDDIESGNRIVQHDVTVTVGDRFRGEEAYKPSEIIPHNATVDQGSIDIVVGSTLGFPKKGKITFHNYRKVTFSNPTTDSGVHTINVPYDSTIAPGQKIFKDHGGTMMNASGESPSVEVTGSLTGNAPEHSVYINYTRAMEVLDNGVVTSIIPIPARADGLSRVGMWVYNPNAIQTETYVTEEKDVNGQNCIYLSKQFVIGDFEDNKECYLRFKPKTFIVSDTLSSTTAGYTLIDNDPETVLEYDNSGFDDHTIFHNTNRYKKTFTKETFLIKEITGGRRGYWKTARKIGSVDLVPATKSITVRNAGGWPPSGRVIVNRGEDLYGESMAEVFEYNGISQADDGYVLTLPVAVYPEWCHPADVYHWSKVYLDYNYELPTIFKGQCVYPFLDNQQVMIEEKSDLNEATDSTVEVEGVDAFHVPTKGVFRIGSEAFYYENASLQKVPLSASGNSFEDVTIDGNKIEIDLSVNENDWDGVQVRKTGTTLSAILRVLNDGTAELIPTEGALAATDEFEIVESADQNLVAKVSAATVKTYVQYTPSVDTIASQEVKINKYDDASTIDATMNIHGSTLTIDLPDGHDLEESDQIQIKDNQGALISYLTDETGSEAQTYSDRFKDRLTATIRVIDTGVSVFLPTSHGLEDGDTFKIDSGTTDTEIMNHLFTFSESNPVTATVTGATDTPADDLGLYRIASVNATFTTVEQSETKTTTIVLTDYTFDDTQDVYFEYDLGRYDNVVYSGNTVTFNDGTASLGLGPIILEGKIHYKAKARATTVTVTVRLPVLTAAQQNIPDNTEFTITSHGKANSTVINTTETMTVDGRMLSFFHVRDVTDFDDDGNPVYADYPFNLTDQEVKLNENTLYIEDILEGVHSATVNGAATSIDVDGEGVARFILPDGMTGDLTIVCEDQPLLDTTLLSGYATGTALAFTPTIQDRGTEDVKVYTTEIPVETNATLKVTSGKATIVINQNHGFTGTDLLNLVNDADEPLAIIPEDFSATFVGKAAKLSVMDGTATILLDSGHGLSSGSHRIAGSQDSTFDDKDFDMVIDGQTASFNVDAVDTTQEVVLTKNGSSYPATISIKDTKLTVHENITSGTYGIAGVQLLNGETTAAEHNFSVDISTNVTVFGKVTRAIGGSIPTPHGTGDQVIVDHIPLKIRDAGEDFNAINYDSFGLNVSIRTGITALCRKTENMPPVARGYVVSPGSLVSSDSLVSR